MSEDLIAKLGKMFAEAAIIVLLAYIIIRIALKRNPTIKEWLAISIAALALGFVSRFL